MLEEIAFLKKYDKHDSAATEMLEKKVYFRRKHFTKGIVAHELLHVYSFSCCLYSASDMSADDREEILAEVVELHLDRMIKLRNEIYRELK